MRGSYDYQWLYSALLALLTFTPVSAQPVSNQEPLTRWLWIAGEQSGEGCDTLIKEVNQSFINRLSELVPVEVVSDAQTLPCRDERCLNARTVAAGAKVGLSTRVTCTERSMLIDLIILPNDRPALRFREGMSRAAKPQRGQKTEPHPRGGPPISPHLSVTQALGVKLAHKVTLGAKPKPQAPSPSPVKTGAWLSLSHEVATQPELLGGGAHLELVYAAHDTPVRWYSTLGFEISQSDRYAQRRLTSAWGGRRHLSQGRLSPVIGGCLELSYDRSKRRVDRLVSANAPQGESIFTREESSIESREELNLRPALEVGLSWRGRTLELAFITRLSPSTLVPLDLNRGAWATLLGVRW